MNVSHQELNSLIHRLEDGQRQDRDEVLSAIKDLKTAMNGQFKTQGEILHRHDTELRILKDREGRDMPARWTAVVGGILALLASYFGIKG